MRFNIIYKVINEIFKKDGRKYNACDIQTLVYKIVPMSHNFGGIEYIDNCIKICDIEKTNEIEKCLKMNMDI